MDAERDERADGVDADADPGTFGVADGQWRRVREVAERLARMEEAVAEMVDPDADSLARLDRLRIKAARAAERARLADSLAEHLTDIADRRRASAASSPSDNRIH